jgi:AmiR/NasT family two-component response regulator
MPAGPMDSFARLRIVVACDLDEQAQVLIRELQRTKAQVTHRWPMPERIGEGADIVLCEFSADLPHRYSWMPGEATGASIILLPQSGRYEIGQLQAALPDAVLHRPYQSHAIRAALVIAWDHFSYSRRQRMRIARLDENVRALRDIERAKHIIMAERHLDETRAFNVLRTMAMERRISVAALAATVVDSRDPVG